MAARGKASLPRATPGNANARAPAHRTAPRAQALLALVVANARQLNEQRGLLGAFSWVGDKLLHYAHTQRSNTIEGEAAGRARWRHCPRLAALSSLRDCLVSRAAVHSPGLSTLPCTSPPPKHRLPPQHRGALRRRQRHVSAAAEPRAGPGCCHARRCTSPCRLISCPPPPAHPSLTHPPFCPSPAPSPLTPQVRPLPGPHHDLLLRHPHRPGREPGAGAVQQDRRGARGGGVLQQALRSASRPSLRCQAAPLCVPMPDFVSPAPAPPPTRTPPLQLIDAAGLGPDDSVLEIGCGWGAFAIRAVQRTGCRVTGLTLSKEQLAEATLRVDAAGLSDRIKLLLCDYRCGDSRGGGGAVPAPRVATGAAAQASVPCKPPRCTRAAPPHPPPAPCLSPPPKGTAPAPAPTTRSCRVR
jgi:hypothetical protein